MIITIHVPPAQIDALILLAGGESDFLRSVTASAAQGVARKLQDHLIEFDAAHPNKMGWPRQHFVKGLSDDIQLDDQAVTAEGAQITASPEFFHRLEGGDVRPVRTKNLAIPARAAAYAAGSPGEGRTPPLTLLLSNKGGTIHAIALALVDGAPKKAFAKLGLDAQIWYWLTAGPVHHDGNPEMMPEESELREAALAGAEEVLAMQLGANLEGVA